MIIRCHSCNSPIFGNTCLCKKRVIRCPDCGGDGRRKRIELLDDADGFQGYILKTQKGLCPTCGGEGWVSVVYRRFNGGQDK